MDESRKAFERFLREEHLYTGEELAWEDDRNCYSIYPVHIAWKSWQASREAIEIELPKKIEHQPFDTDFENGFCGGHNNAIDSATIRISEAGIKVKE